MSTEVGPSKQDGLFGALCETGLRLQALILDQRAEAAAAGDDAAVQQLTDRFREVNTTTRNLDRNDPEQLHLTMHIWQDLIDNAGPPSQGG